MNRREILRSGIGLLALPLGLTAVGPPAPPKEPQQITIVLHPDDGAFGKLVRAAVIEDVQKRGPILEAIRSDAR